MKNNKGITLIALIITIIILLILAIVTINSITGDDSLIAHAENARDKYALEAEKENTIIQNLLNKIPVPVPPPPPTRYTYKVYNSNVNTGDYDNLKVVVEITEDNIVNRLGMFFYSNGEMLSYGYSGWQNVGAGFETLEGQVTDLRFVLNEEKTLGAEENGATIQEIVFNAGDLECGGAAYIKTGEGIEKLYLITEDPENGLPWDGYEFDLVPGASVQEFLNIK